MVTINSFSGHYRFLSNFYPARVTLDGIEYPTVEHAYQAAKTLDSGERQVVRRAGTPGDAKRAGRRVTKRGNWESVKLTVMGNLLRQKFKSHRDLRQQLLETRDMQLIEGNTWSDTYWGQCDGVGENHLGRLLMQIREELKEG
jgi:ribA/ribD-fused uncharacterized protein